MVWICRGQYLGQPCRYCTTTAGNEPPTYSCPMGHDGHWEPATDVNECRGWTGRPVPGGGSEGMSTIRRSQNFVPVEQVPQIFDTTTIPEVFRQLSTRRAGGFVLLYAGRPRRFVVTKDLVAAVVARASEKSYQEVGGETLHELIESPGVGPGGILVAEAAVEGGMEPMAVAGRSDVVLPVQEQGQLFGWFFSEEAMKEVITIPPPQWVCMNGHKNPDPDRGKCYRCPAPIVRTES